MRSRILKEYLVKWHDLPLDDATWEGAEILNHSALQLLEDKQFEKDGLVMSQK